MGDKTSMIQSGSAAFLQQAHRNNWQQYLASLKPYARAGWDVCILTASDERQAAMYRRQLDGRREAGTPMGGLVKGQLSALVITTQPP